MLRGAGGGARPHHRRHRLRQRRESAAAAAPSLKEASALEAPVVASVEETSFTFEFKRGLKRAKKADSRSMAAPAGEGDLREGLSSKKNVVAGKTPIAKQEPEQVELTHCAPSIVARLMGLDTMPRTKKVLHRCQSDVRLNRQQQLSRGVEDREAPRISARDQPHNVSANELPALKDVFEVSEMENMVMNEVLRSGNKKPHLRSSEADLEFVRKKFMDVKRLSTDEAQRNSKEFSEALEILHSKKDVFLEILQDNRTAVSGFSGNILNHSGLQLSPHTSAADSMQSFEQEILCNMEVQHAETSDAATDSDTPNMLLKEMSVTPLKPLEQDGSKNSGRRSHIVVLKPDLQRNRFTPVLSSQEASKYDRRNSKQYAKPSKQAVTHSGPNSETSEQGGRIIHRARKQTPKSSGRRRSSGEGCKLAVDIEGVKVASTSRDDIIPICSSTGSSVSRKARKHLSERWQTACQCGSENSTPRDIKTLGEILELSNDNVREVPASPLGISSKDGWKAGINCEDHSQRGISRNFSRSKSLPASSTSSANFSGRRQSQSASTCRLPILKDILNTPTDESENARVKKRSPRRNAKQKNGKSIVQVGKENILREKEIHVTSEKERHSICISDLSQAANTYPDDAIRSRDQQTYEVSVQHKQQNSKAHMGCFDSKLTIPFPETEEDKSICYQDIIALKEEGNPSIEIDIAEDDVQEIQPAHIPNAENCEYSSPSSPSQQSPAEEMSYSGIFSSINVGIQGLRAQLKMLKMDNQDDTCGYYSDTFSSDEGSNITYLMMEEQVPLFKDEEDRDFSYVQDMLAGVCGFRAYPEDWQVSPDVFLGLENKYNKLLLWSKSDRKLLFDLVNSVLADMTGPSSSLHSKIMARCFSEKEHGQFDKYAWQMVQKRRCYEQVAWDCILPLPLDHHSELELIKVEIFKMIHDDIIEESIIKFMSKKN